VTTAERAFNKIAAGETLTRGEAEAIGWRFILALEGDEARIGKVNWRASQDEKGASAFGADEEVILRRISSWEFSQASLKPHLRAARPAVGVTSGQVADPRKDGGA
jgi:hypothetical protein